MIKTATYCSALLLTYFWSPEISHHIFYKDGVSENLVSFMLIVFPGDGHNHEHTAVAEKVSLKSGAETKILSDNGSASSPADVGDEELEEVNIDTIRGKPKMRKLCLFTIKSMKYVCLSKFC